jgi:hypothetical protein
VKNNTFFNFSCLVARGATPRSVPYAWMDLIEEGRELQFGSFSARVAARIYLLTDWRRVADAIQSLVKINNMNHGLLLSGCPQKYCSHRNSPFFPEPKVAISAVYGG